MKRNFTKNENNHGQIAAQQLADGERHQMRNESIPMRKKKKTAKKHFPVWTKLMALCESDTKN